MNAIRNKLTGKKGASIFMGIMFLLVCLMVGTVALAASTAAAGKLAELRQHEQDYLTVASAARLVKNRISKLTYTHEKVEQTTLGSTSLVSTTSNLEASEGDVILESELLSLCSTLVDDEVPAALPTEQSFEIKLDSSSGSTPDVEWETVYGSLNMGTDGKIVIELWLGVQTKGDAKNHNRMKVEFIPNGPVVQTVVTSSDSGGVITETTTTTTKYSWPESGCTITKGTA